MTVAAGGGCGDRDGGPGAAPGRGHKAAGGAAACRRFSDGGPGPGVHGLPSEPAAEPGPDPSRARRL